MNLRRHLSGCAQTCPQHYHLDWTDDDVLSCCLHRTWRRYRCDSRRWNLDLNDQDLGKCLPEMCPRPVRYQLERTIRRRNHDNLLQTVVLRGLRHRTWTWRGNLESEGLPGHRREEETCCLVEGCMRPQRLRRRYHYHTRPLADNYHQAWHELSRREMECLPKRTLLQ